MVAVSGDDGLESEPQDPGADGSAASIERHQKTYGDRLGEICTGIREETLADRRAVVEAAPDVLVTMPTGRTKAAERERLEFRARVARLGERLGFKVAPDGTWSRGAGIDLITRVSERHVTAAAAAHFVSEICQKARAADTPAAVLFVVRNEESARTFAVAIRQRRCADVVRAISVQGLERAAALHGSGRLTEPGVMALLAAVASVDAGAALEALFPEAVVPDEGSSDD